MQTVGNERAGWVYYVILKNSVDRKVSFNLDFVKVIKQNHVDGFKRNGPITVDKKIDSGDSHSKTRKKV